MLIGYMPLILFVIQLAINCASMHLYGQVAQSLLTDLCWCALVCLTRFQMDVLTTKSVVRLQIQESNSLVTSTSLSTVWWIASSISFYTYESSETWSCINNRVVPIVIIFDTITWLCSPPHGLHFCFARLNQLHTSDVPETSWMCIQEEGMNVTAAFGYTWHRSCLCFGRNLMVTLNWAASSLVSCHLMCRFVWNDSRFLSSGLFLTATFNLNYNVLLGAFGSIGALLTAILISSQGIVHKDYSRALFSIPTFFQDEASHQAAFVLAFIDLLVQSVAIVRICAVSLFHWFQREHSFLDSTMFLVVFLCFRSCLVSLHACCPALAASGPYVFMRFCNERGLLVRFLWAYARNAVVLIRPISSTFLPSTACCLLLAVAQRIRRIVPSYSGQIFLLSVVIIFCVFVSIAKRVQVKILQTMLLASIVISVTSIVCFRDIHVCYD